MLKSTSEKDKKVRKIYLDYASSARADSANPSAIHYLGVAEKNKLEKARKTISDILGARRDEIIFTSGATESNNLSILGIFNVTQKQDFFRSPTRPLKNLVSVPHIVTTNIEHASVLEVCKNLEKNKIAEVTYVKVEKNGIVDSKKIRKALKANTVLVSVMYANNEIGTIQPIREIAKEIRHFRKKATKQKVFPFFHMDATQAINYLPIKVEALGIDLMSFNAAKIYGPKGVGVLYVKRGTPISPIMFGGSQERGLRPGTENVAGALGLAEALGKTENIKAKEVKRLTVLRDYFINKLINLNFNLTINGDLKNRLPNNINITIPKIPSDLLVIELSAKGVLASSKSACKAGDGKASYVIEAVNPTLRDTDGSLRFSLGRQTTKRDIDFAFKALFTILKKLKIWYN